MSEDYMYSKKMTFHWMGDPRMDFEETLKKVAALSFFSHTPKGN